jgi:MFS superfamily sulfate permease-like transporter
VLVPITAALVLGNGLDAGTALVGVGLLYLLSGLYFRVPVPVQPIKAAAAIAIARDLPPETLATAGVLLGASLLILGATGLSRWLAKAFSVPIVRGLQLGVGLILIKTALTIAAPDLGMMPLLMAGAIAIVLLIVGRARSRYPVALAIVIAGAAYAIVTGGVPTLDVGLLNLDLNGAAFRPSVVASAFVLLVVPQIPLTFGNAVVAVVELEHRYFPVASRRVTPESVSISSGVANIVAGSMTGMPVCHGSGGLTAHYRAGARSFRMNVMIGSALLIMGLFFGPAALGVLTLIPAVVLAGFLAFTGLFHSSLAVSLRGWDLVVAITIGLLGLVTTNLAIALAVGLLLYWPLALITSRRAMEPART